MSCVRPENGPRTVISRPWASATTCRVKTGAPMLARVQLPVAAPAPHRRERPVHQHDAIGDRSGGTHQRGEQADDARDGGLRDVVELPDGLLNMIASQVDRGGLDRLSAARAHAA